MDDEDVNLSGSSANSSRAGSIDMLAGEAVDAGADSNGIVGEDGGDLQAEHEGGAVDGGQHSDALVHVGDHFDWEQYIMPYRGRARIERLLFLAEHSPALRIPCSNAAIEAQINDLTSSASRDVLLYRRAVEIRNTSPEAGNPFLPVHDRVETSQELINTTERRNQTELEKLDLELRNYQNNMIKESTRIGHRDLADHLRSTGDLLQAQKLFIKTRDYCSTSEHVIEMCLNVIEVSLELRQYHIVQGYVSKAEALLDSYNPAAAAASAKKSAGSGQPAQKGATTSGADAIGALFRAGGSSSAQDTMSLSSASAMLNAQRGTARRDADEGNKKQVAAIRSRLHVANGIAFLGLKRYRDAAVSFLQVDAAHHQAYAMMASQGDVAIYLVLCSMAVFDRAELKRRVMDKPDLSAILEGDLQVKQTLHAFYACEYKRALDLLERLQTRLYLDVYCSAHCATLLRRITQRILRQFIEPFDTLKIERLAHALGWTDTEGEARAIDEVLNLIQQKQINARMDLSRKIIVSKKQEQRQELFDHALKAGRQQTAAAKRLLLRIDLLQNGLVVKLPHDSA